MTEYFDKYNGIVGVVVRVEKAMEQLECYNLSMLQMYMLNNRHH